uniref:NVEALA domain-containing protein n=1 Tax=Phocaeicola massiliensis TaxID=204516 RepID=UPI00402506BA
MYCCSNSNEFYRFFLFQYNTNDLLLDNIEALANGEQENGIKCIGEGTVDCPIGIKVEAVIRFYGLE